MIMQFLQQLCLRLSSKTNQFNQTACAFELSHERDLVPFMLHVPNTPLDWNIDRAMFPSPGLLGRPRQVGRVWV